MDDLKARLKTFSQSDWAIVIGLAVAFMLVLDGAFGLIVGAIVGYLIVRRHGSGRDARRKPRDEKTPAERRVS